jgi:hypothetical protein
VASVAVEVAGAEFVGDFGSVVAFGDFPREACSSACDQGVDGSDVGKAL